MDIEIYTTPYCPYCNTAKSLLDSKGLSYTEIDVCYPDARQAMTDRCNGLTSVPQVFINGSHIGGCTELVAYSDEGSLQ